MPKKFICPATVTVVVLSRCTATGLVCVIIGYDVWAYAFPNSPNNTTSPPNGTRLTRMMSLQRKRRAEDAGPLFPHQEQETEVPRSPFDYRASRGGNQRPSS